MKGVYGYIFLIKFAENSLQTKWVSEKLLKSQQQLCPSYQSNVILPKIHMQAVPGDRRE